MFKNCGNIFAALPEKTLPEEIVEPLLQGENFKLERIISTGQITPEGEWYDQPQDEWVILLKGTATILFDNDTKLTLQPGDYVFIPAHRKHRVTWTDPGEACVWLAFHIER